MHCVVDTGSSAHEVSTRFRRLSEHVGIGKLTESCSKNDSDGRAQFHGEASGGRVKGDLIAQIAHDVIAVGPQANNDCSTTESPEIQLDSFKRIVDLLSK